MECIVNKASMYTLFYVEIVGSAVSYMRILCYVDIVDSSEFFTFAYNVKVHVQFFSQFYVDINVELNVHAFMSPCLVRLWFFRWWKLTGKSDVFFYISCCMLIWVRIIPVKVDQSLTGIIRSYVSIDVVRIFPRSHCERNVKIEQLLAKLFFFSISASNPRSNVQKQKKQTIICKE